VFTLRTLASEGDTIAEDLQKQINKVHRASCVRHTRYKAASRTSVRDFSALLALNNTQFHTSLIGLRGGFQAALDSGTCRRDELVHDINAHSEHARQAIHA
ncbi:hypothetical protein BGZ54_009341, partial [Gamsiella multidivaricata]